MIRIRWMLGVLISIALSLALFGSRLLTSDTPPPRHVEAAVVLQGSVIAGKARIAAAVNLLRTGASDRILISVPRESYWGQSIPPIAQDYIARNYGNDIAAKIDFCETSEEVDSTRQEAIAVSRCIQERHWNSIEIVTSEYHTRRAGFLWRRALRQTGTQIWIQGVADTDFERRWWRSRRSAKTFVMELSKLTWALVAER